jgi:hypothetical protein
MDNSAVFQVEAAKEFVVGNIYAASFVYCRGVRLITVVPSQNRSAAFMFDNADGIAERTVAAYYGDTEININGRDLHDALRSLKQELESAKGPQAQADAVRRA